jgi:hypothetical protein
VDQKALAPEKAQTADEKNRRFALLVALMAPRERRVGMTPGASAEQGANSLNEQERHVVTRANQDRVRAGVTRHKLRYVLIVSIAIVVVAFIAIYLFMR